MGENISAAKAEWRANFMLPISAMFGASLSTLSSFGAMPYLLAVTEEFGWTREQFSSAVAIVPIVLALTGVFVGMAIDRFGTRLFGLVGIIALGGAFALLSTSTGSLTNWYFLWALVAVCTLPVQMLVWTTAIPHRFQASRGLALAVTLCGNPLGQMVFPPLVIALIASFGWRTAMVIQGLGWMALCLVIVIFFFRDGPKVEKAEKADTNAMSIADGLRSSIYLRLLLTAMFYTFAVVPLLFNFIPIAKENGLNAQSAAWLASLIGISAIIGRILTGLLIDRFPAAWVGALAFLLPMIASLLMLFGGNSYPAILTAAVLIGLAMGAETDVLTYLTAQYFGLKNFGALSGGLHAALTLGIATGPILASSIFDNTQAYDNFLWLAIGLVLVAGAVLASLPKEARVPNIGSGQTGNGAIA